MNVLEYELSESDLLAFQSKFPYENVEKVVRFKEFVFVYIGKAMALVIPEHRIPDDALDAFIAELLERTEKPLTAP